MSFYDVDEYYTHGAGNKNNSADLSFSQKLQTKLSWWADKGAEPNKEWWGRALTKKNMRILEIGCGNGSNLAIFKSLGHDAIGVEPDVAALEVARQQGHTVFQGTAEELPQNLLHERFDAIVFIHVLEHCIDPFVALKNAVELLENGGVLVAEVPNNECLGAKRFGELWYWLDVPRHLNFFTERSLCDLMSFAGVSKHSIFYRGYCRQFDDDWKKSQSHIASVMGKSGDSRVSSPNYWKYLFGTIFARDAKKYDSIRIVASL
jgi:SAM-dependent methyltransferase